MRHAGDILIGARPYVSLVGSTSERARSMVESIKTELECNELLLADFSGVVYPIHRLERIHNRYRWSWFAPASAAQPEFLGQPALVLVAAELLLADESAQPCHLGIRGSLPGTRGAGTRGVAVSVIERRRYGYEFAAATVGRDGQIVLGEDDDLGHLWLYFPRISGDD